MRARKFNWAGKESELRMLSKTHTMKGAAEVIGCTKGQVSHKAKLLGISFRKYGELHHSAKFSNEDIRLARELVEAGISKQETAEKLELPLHVVSADIRRRLRRSAG